VRFHSTERVLAEIGALVTDHRIEGIYIADDVFLAKDARAAALCEALIRAGMHKRIRWCCQLRVNGLRMDTLKLLRHAGCVQVEFGIESGSQYVLDLMRKRATVDENREALLLARRAGLRVLANIIVGYPGERREDLAQTRALLEAARPDVISVNRFAPLPGAPVFDELREQRRLPESWASCTVGNAANYTEMPDEEFEAAVAAMRRDLAEPTYLRSFYLGDLRRRPRHYAAEVARRLWRSPVATSRRLFSIVAGRATQRHP